MGRVVRWSDNDRRFGPFTYSRERHSDRLGVVITSGRAEDDDSENGCYIRFHAFGHSLLAALPQIIKPARHWVDTSRHSWASGRGGYWEVWARDYGFVFTEGALHLDYGVQTHDSTTDKSKCLFLPWRSWRHVRRSFYGLQGEHVATLPDTGKSYRLDSGRWDRERAIEEATPTVSFDFDDFDGERITATTKIEEREWRLGEGKFKWLSFFRSPKIRRSLDLRFSAEVGKRKGSWKGGTVGHSIDMRPGELHEAAFRRYCAENRMKFVGAAEVEAA